MCEDIPACMRSNISVFLNMCANNSIHTVYTRFHGVFVRVRVFPLCFNVSHSYFSESSTTPNKASNRTIFIVRRIQSYCKIRKNYVCAHTSVYASEYTVYVYIHIQMCVRIYVCRHVCMYTRLYVFVRVYVCSLWLDMSVVFCNRILRPWTNVICCTFVVICSWI